MLSDVNFVVMIAHFYYNKKKNRFSKKCRTFLFTIYEHDWYNRAFVSFILNTTVFICTVVALLNILKI